MVSEFTDPRSYDNLMDSGESGKNKRRRENEENDLGNDPFAEVEDESERVSERISEHDNENINARENANRNDQNPQRQFVPNEHLDEEPQVKLVAAPTDKDATEAEIEEEEQHIVENNSSCFACRYARTADQMAHASGTWHADDVRDAYSDMTALIAENYGRGVSNKELVNMVHEFYEREIRSLHDYGVWSKKSILRHILYHSNDDDVHLQESGAILYAQIQALRGKTWIETNGTLEPHHKNIYLLEKLVKGLGDHINRKRSRAAGQQSANASTANK